MIGRIRRLIATKGFGFIKTEDGEEFFFHMKAYKGDWDELVKLCSNIADESSGPEVYFKEQKHIKGPRAISVELI